VPWLSGDAVIPYACMVAVVGVDPAGTGERKAVAGCWGMVGGTLEPAGGAYGIPGTAVAWSVWGTTYGAPGWGRPLP
jgi:hypothetical protein